MTTARGKNGGSHPPSKNVGKRTASRTCGQVHPFAMPRRQRGRPTCTPTWLLVAVVVLGAGLRVANILDISDSPSFTRPVIDGQAYDRWALAIIGRPSTPEVAATVKAPFYQDPLYPYLLALVYSVFGHSYWAVYLLQFVLGVLLLLIVYDTAQRLFDWRAGIIAAVFAALYKPFIFYESQIEKTALAIFLTALFIFLFVRALTQERQVPGRSPGIRSLLWPFTSGLGLGLAALTRANMLLFTPLLPLALALRPPATGRKPRIASAAAGLLGALLIIAPVSIRNSLLAREFVLTTTQAGQNLYIGNSPYNATGQYQAPPWVRPTTEFEQSDFARHASRAAGKPLSPSAVSRFYTREAIHWATRHGRDFTKLLWRKTMLYFNDYEVPDNEDMYSFARHSWVLRLPLLSFGLVFALGSAAMVLTARGLGRVSLTIFFFASAASVIVFFIFSRYRTPALPALLPFAGAMLPWLVDSIRAAAEDRGRPGSKWLPRLAGGFTLVLVALALTLYPLRRSNSRNEAAQGLVNLGVLYYHESDTSRAIAAFEDALSMYPGQAEASRNLGIIMFERGAMDRAFQLLSDAARTAPSTPSTHFFLGGIHKRRGQLEAACLELGKAVGLAPEQADFRAELADVLQKLDRYSQAIPQYDTAIQLVPENLALRYNYMVCLYKVGRLDDARLQLAAIRRLGGTVGPDFDSLLKQNHSTQ
ncbi:tetratricopeptide repeat protein [candidate division WOR-3 bacterium]|uniref:Tetratricopeptide repeat protein n=1 Tax=candidate division WOR-3 bacterium TaxID=2052148 RepID=A0A937XFY0_UNCW3|nr:tetratricopeptide repeat protein [candidate division WOR-3 bacterium]